VREFVFNKGHFALFRGVRAVKVRDIVTGMML
jgi:hypothetical protein